MNNWHHISHYSFLTQGTFWNLCVFAKREGQSQCNKTYSVAVLILYLSIIHLVDAQLYIGQSVHTKKCIEKIMLWKVMLYQKSELPYLNVVGNNLVKSVIKFKFTEGIHDNDRSCLHSESFDTKLVSLWAQWKVSHCVLVSTWVYDFLIEGAGHVWTLFKIVRIPFSHCRALALPGGGREHAVQSCSGTLQKYISIGIYF